MTPRQLLIYSFSGCCLALTLQSLVTSLFMLTRGVY